MKITRQYTKAGRSPYAGIDFEERTTHLDGKEGKVLHHQEGLVFPTSWSQIATDITAQKYFRRKDVNHGHANSLYNSKYSKKWAGARSMSLLTDGSTPEIGYEYDIRQVIHRMVGCWTDWGARYNYFDTHGDAQAFYDELSYMLVNQMFAPNSPQWFNTGLFWAYGIEGVAQGHFYVDPNTKELTASTNAYEHVQAHACLPGHAWITTPNGPKTIKDIVDGNHIGLEVFDLKGITKVLAVKNNGVKPVYKVKLGNGNFIEATADHLVWASPVPKNRRKWTRVDELRPGMRLIQRTDTRMNHAPYKPQLDRDVALAGWLQGDGFVGQYAEGTNNSLTVEALSVDSDEYKYVHDLITSVWPGLHAHERKVAAINTDLDITRERLYGECLRDFVEKFHLLPRGVNLEVPELLTSVTSPYALHVKSYLRALFQADGCVRVREDCGTAGTSNIVFGTISEKLAVGVSRLLLNLGIYNRISQCNDSRPDRNTYYHVVIAYERAKNSFGGLIDFVSSKQRGKLNVALELPGKRPAKLRDEVIESIEYVGEMEVYDIETESHSFLTNNVVVHNCFILSVKDDLVNDGGIFDLFEREARIFKLGSGAGTNYSTLRGENEPLSGGGKSSGLMSFLPVGDRGAGAIKSGGTCLAAGQHVYTAKGPIPVKTLADAAEKFVVLSFDPPANRYKAKWASAWHAGRKEVVRITTDKGVFETSFDHPFRLSSDETRLASSLSPGNSLFQCMVKGRNRDKKTGEHRYLQVGLKNGHRGAVEDLHIMVAQDILGWDTQGRVVHHVNRNSHDSAPNNLELLASQSEHAGEHGRADYRDGVHPFLFLEKGREGSGNGMHHSNRFWQNTSMADSYRHNKSKELLQRGTARDMQRASTRLRMLNKGYSLLNQGLPFTDYDSYVKARLAASPAEWTGNIKLKRFEHYFGGFDGFIQALAAENHRVISVESLGEQDVYDVEVECLTLDDKTAASGHNFVIWPSDKKIGSGVVVYNTRRAARMAILNADHPDVEKFVNWKVEEERKVVALTIGSIRMKEFWDEIRPVGADVKAAIRSARRSGIPSAFIAQCLARIAQNDRTDDLKVYDTSWEGEGYQSVSGMNANNTIRVTDEFMVAVEKGKKWDLVNRTGGVAKSLFARDLMKQINKASYLCGDPGLQFDTTINDWHTVPNAGRINASNPCSEFVHLDNTACNLASGNLLKFWKDNEFDMFGYQHMNKLVTVVLEISVLMAQFPSKEIADLSFKFRPLGLGYANLGALLMRIGVPYDSEAGRNWAAAITACMTATAYATSAWLASEHGAFKGFATNQEEMLQVIRNHSAAAHNDPAGYVDLHLVPFGLKDAVPGGAPPELLQHARTAWKSAVTLGEKFGYRNSQATVLAPTGTIGLAMDCDTTGVEPDYSCVKYKKLAGGGYVKIVNQGVSAALQNLGYAPSKTTEIIAYIDVNGTIEGAPYVQEEHLAVFDCAQKAGTGKRFIQPSGHVLMMAACQPFISGAISKTVNLPDEATISDVNEIHKLAWKSGIKAIAIYRNGSKMSQALATNMALLDGSEADILEDATASTNAKVGALATALARGFRKRLPDSCRGLRQKAKIGNHTLYLHTGEYEDGKLGEVFVDISREGATLRSLLNSFAIAISLGLQYGVPLDEFADAFCFTRFEPAGLVQGSKHIKMCDSIIDYIFRELAVGYLGRYELAHVPPEPKKGIVPDAVVERQVDERTQAQAMGFTGNLCSNCGSMELVRSGTCSTCKSCGSTTGCS